MNESYIGNIKKRLEERLLPLIRNMADKSDIERIERKIDKLVDGNLDHESRIKAIEQVPVVAHQLRFKKSK